MRNEIYFFVYFLNGERVSYDYAYIKLGDTPTRLACQSVSACGLTGADSRCLPML